MIIPIPINVPNNLHTNFMLSRYLTAKVAEGRNVDSKLSFLNIPIFQSDVKFVVFRFVTLKHYYIYV